MNIYPNPMSDNMYYDPYESIAQKPGYDRPLAMAYVRMQHEVKNAYTPDEALCHGTLFPELYKPFLGKRGIL